MERENWSRRKLLGALGSGLAGGLAGCSFGAPQQPPRPQTGGDGSSSVGDQYEQYSTGNDQAQTEGAAGSAYTQVYREVRDSVAAVRIQQQFGQTARGTAWLYDDTYLVTNEHVVSDADDVSIWFDGSGWREGQTVATDVYSDLAVIDIEDPPENAQTLSLVEREPAVGTEVVAIGNPFGLSGSISTGIVSGQDRSLPAANGFSIPDAVQTDAAVNPGNSGGPLVTLDGQVVGVVNAGGGDNIGFAISAAMVERVVPALIQSGSYEHPYMGVQLTDVTPPIVEANDLPLSWGIYIDDVVDNTPSDGVLQGSTGETSVDGQSVPEGGDVIYRIDGSDIPTQQALSTFLALETSPGDTVDVEVVRDGARQTLQLTLGSRPEP